MRRRGLGSTVVRLGKRAGDSLEEMVMEVTCLEFVDKEKLD